MLLHSFLFYDCVYNSLHAALFPGSKSFGLRLKRPVLCNKPRLSKHVHPSLCDVTNESVRPPQSFCLIHGLVCDRVTFSRKLQQA